MAMRFMDGMDSYGVVDDMRKQYQYTQLSGSAAIVLDATGGPNGTQCMTSGNDALCLVKALPNDNSAATDHYVAFWWKSDLVDRVTKILHVRSENVNALANDNIYITTTADNNLSLYRITGTLVVTTTTAPLVDGQWHHIEVRFQVSATAEVDVWVDETLEINETGVDTHDEGSLPQSPNAFYFYGQDSKSYYDDIVIWDDIGTGQMTAQMGKHLIDTLRPEADGNYTDFTLSTGSDHYAVVDDTGTPADTDHAEASTNTNKDSYTYPDAGDTYSSFFAVGVNTFSRGNGSDFRTTKEFLRMSSTDYEGIEATTTPTDDYEHSVSYWDEHPDGVTGNWVFADFNNIETGIKVES
jgi:hypothetical protein